MQKALACFPLGCQEHLSQRVFQVVHLLEAFAELTDDKTQGWHPRGRRPYVNERVPILLTILYVKSLDTGPIQSKPNQHKDHPFNTKDIQCCYICPAAFVYTLLQDSNFPSSIQISALHLNLKQDTHQPSTVNPPIFCYFFSSKDS